MKNSTIDILDNLFVRYEYLKCLRLDIIEAVKILIQTYNNGGKLLVCGNGGSAADSFHIVGELMKSFVLKRKLPQYLRDIIKLQYPEHSDYYDNLEMPLTAISLINEVGLTTAYANDRCSDLVFAQQVLGYGMKTDVLLGITTSGNSSNVLHAARIAKIKGLRVISLTGISGGAILLNSDVCIRVPSEETYKIQEMHLPIYHTICLALENEFFGDE